MCSCPETESLESPEGWGLDLGPRLPGDVAAQDTDLALQYLRASFFSSVSGENNSTTPCSCPGDS